MNAYEKFTFHKVVSIIHSILKPALMIMLERIVDAGIDEIALIIGDDEQDEFEKFFAPLPQEYKENLSAEKQIYDEIIVSMHQRITYLIQKERLGFGHAVWLAKEFANNEPVLLLLGDFVYRSTGSESCCKQVIDAYKECGRALVSVTEIPLERVVHYGIIRGLWDDKNESMMKVEKMVEKPTDDYAKEYLGVKDSKGIDKYYSTFGQYVLTAEVFEELEDEIYRGNRTEGKEYGLTAALDRVREKYGLYAFIPHGRSFDIGLPDAYRDTMWNFPM